MDFTPNSSRRIAKAIRKSERQRINAKNRRILVDQTGEKETIFARLTEAVDDGFAWEEVYRVIDTGAWEDLPNGRDSGDNDERLAYDLIEGSSVVSDDPVILRRCPMEDEDGNWVMGWIILTPSSGIAVVEITGNAAGGAYEGTVYRGISTATGAADLVLPEGMTAGEDCLILHAPEDGLPTHWLKVGAYAVGKIIGRTEDEIPKAIVIIDNASARIASPSVLTGTGATADVDTWNREIESSGDDKGDSPVTITFVTRVVWDDPYLKQYTRDATFDAAGNLHSVTAETETTVDTAEDCA